MSNSFEDFTRLPDELQREAINEGIKRIEAQLQVATSADSRALAWGGLLSAAVTASLGAGVALMSKSDPDYVLALLALLFAAAILFACHKALSTVEPERFCLPGNNPSHWLPSEWNCVGEERNKARIARLEQAEALSVDISENAARAERRAAYMKSSFRVARWANLMAGVALLIVLLVRVVPAAVLTH